MIRNVMLDADGTLFDFLAAEREALSKMLKRFGVEATPEILRRYSEINAAHWRLLEQKKITHAELRWRRYEQLFRENQLTISPEEAADCYEELLAMQGNLLAGAEDLVRTLAPKYRLYIASNGHSKTQHGRLGQSGIAPYFSDIFISQEFGFYKPDVHFFEACFERIPDFRREETVMVGDRLSSDILGGNLAGIPTVWINPDGDRGDGEILPTYEIRSLSELPGVIEEIGNGEDGKGKK